MFLTLSLLKLKIIDVTITYLFEDPAACNNKALVNHGEDDDNDDILIYLL